jgi:hypothetical protein
MARYKNTQKGQGLFLTVNLYDQIIPGTYEHTLNHLIDKKLDLSIFDRKYNNDETGSPAIEPRILLKGTSKNSPNLSFCTPEKNALANNSFYRNKASIFLRCEKAALEGF